MIQVAATKGNVNCVRSRADISSAIIIAKKTEINIHMPSLNFSAEKTMAHKTTGGEKIKEPPIGIEPMTY